MTEEDLCGLWLEQAWVDLKAPLTHSGGVHLPQALDAEAMQDLLLALCRGDIQSAHQICARWHGRRQAEMAHALALILPVIEQIEHDWQTDRRSYADTLYAFWNVQRLLQGWGATATQHPQGLAVMAAQPGRLLMASVPGSLHHLGALVVADHFRAQGWLVQTLIDASDAQLRQAVQHECPDVVGLSVGHDAGLQGLADLIRGLRAAAPVGATRIVLGGHAFGPNASGFEWLGADGIATSAQHALRLCAAWRSTPPH